MQVEKNQENKAKKIVKKLSFLWVIIATGLIHFLIKKVGFSEFDEGVYFFLLWLSGILIACYCASYSFDKKFKYRWDEFDKAELDVNASSGKPMEKRGFLEKNGKPAFVKVREFLTYRGGGGGSPTIFVIKYHFNDENNKSFFGIKKIYEGLYNFEPSIPKQGDEIKILYDESNPSDSIIVHEPADKVPWYKLQKKYKIKIITNNTNN